MVIQFGPGIRGSIGGGNPRGAPESHVMVRAIAIQAAGSGHGVRDGVGGDSSYVNDSVGYYRSAPAAKVSWHDTSVLTAGLPTISVIKLSSPSTSLAVNIINAENSPTAVTG